MQTISISELQKNLALYLEKAKDGDEIIVEETGEAIVRISPFGQKDDEALLVEEGLMSLPKRELPSDYWDANLPELSSGIIIETIRGERDED